MPGPLPPNVGYTYALELSADEGTGSVWLSSNLLIFN